MEEECPLPPPGQCSPELRDFVAQCMRKDPWARPTAEQLMRHPFVAQHACVRGRGPGGDAGVAGCSKQHSQCWPAGCDDVPRTDRLLLPHPPPPRAACSCSAGSSPPTCAPSCAAACTTPRRSWRTRVGAACLAGWPPGGRLAAPATWARVPASWVQQGVRPAQCAAYAVGRAGGPAADPPPAPAAATSRTRCSGGARLPLLQQPVLQLARLRLHRRLLRARRGGRAGVGTRCRRGAAGQGARIWLGSRERASCAGAPTHPLAPPGPARCQHLTYCGERLKGRYTVAKHFHGLMRQVGAALPSCRVGAELAGVAGGWVAEPGGQALPRPHAPGGRDAGVAAAGMQGTPCTSAATLQCACCPALQPAPHYSQVRLPAQPPHAQAAGLGDVVLSVEHCDHQPMAGAVRALAPGSGSGWLPQPWLWRGLLARPAVHAAACRRLPFCCLPAADAHPRRCRQPCRRTRC